MNVLRVIPFAKGINTEHLTYFSSQNVKIGSLVEISLRKRKIFGLVVESEDAKDLKTSVKQSNFKLKKIESVIKKKIFDTNFITSLTKSSIHFGTFPSTLLTHFTSATLIQKLADLEKTQRARKGSSYIPYALEQEIETRIESYSKIISEQTKKESSTLILCPTIINTKDIHKQLEKKSNQDTYVLHSKLTPKKLTETWNLIATSKKQITIITTPLFLGIPRHDLAAIIVEQEGSRHYIAQKKPYHDMRSIADNYAQERKLHIYFSDDFLSIEQYKKYKEKNIEMFKKEGATTKKTTPCEIIHMKKKNQSFRIFSPEVIENIKKTYESKKHTLLLVGRKGLAPHVICRDCGQAVSCNLCSKPLILIPKESGDEYNSFFCRLCSQSRSAHEACTHCRSWRLQELGIGTRRIEEEFIELQADHQKLNNCQYFVLDSSIAKNESQVRKIMKQFYESEGSVLIATEMALPHIQKKFGYSAIISIDSMFSLPNITIHEHIMRLLLNIKRISHSVDIQTRLVETNLFEQAQKGGTEDFQRQELALRKMLDYPPYKTFIKFSIQGSSHKALPELEKIQTFLGSYHSDIHTHKDIYSLLIQIDTKEWPKKDLVRKIQKLPPYVKTEINPNQV